MGQGGDDFILVRWLIPEGLWLLIFTSQGSLMIKLNYLKKHYIDFCTSTLPPWWFWLCRLTPDTDSSHRKDIRAMRDETTGALEQILSYNRDKFEQRELIGGENRDLSSFLRNSVLNSTKCWLSLWHKIPSSGSCAFTSDQVCGTPVAPALWSCLVRHVYTELVRWEDPYG